MRTFESRYKNRPYKNFKEFYLALGTDADLFQRFNFLLKELIDKCIELGGPLVDKVRMDWNDCERRATLYLEKTERFKIRRAPDKMIEKSKYLSQGHSVDGRTVVAVDGLDYVLVPTEEEMTCVRETLIDSTIKKKVADDVTATNKHDLFDTQTSVIDQFAFKATGVPIAAPHTPLQRLGPIGDSTRSSGAKIPLQDAGGSSSGFGFGIVLPTPKIVESSSAKSPLSKPEAKKKATGKGQRKTAQIKPVLKSPTKPGCKLKKAGTGNSKAKASLGRPSRDFKCMLSEWLLKLSESTSDAKALWGDDWPTTKRWVERQEKDFRAFLQGLEDREEYDAGCAVMKPFSQVKPVCAAYHNDELNVEDSDAFAATLDAAVRFLEMPPVAPSPFPPWIHSARHKRRIAVTDEAIDFWNCIDDGELIANGFVNNEDIINKLKQGHIAEWLLKTMQSTVDIPKDKLVEFIQAAPVAVLPSRITTPLDKILCNITLGKKRIVKYEPVTPYEVLPSDFSDPTDPIMRAFVTYPCGRKAARAYKHKVDTAASLLKLGGDLEAMLNEVGGIVLSESTFDGDKVLDAAHRCQLFLDSATADDLLVLSTSNSTGNQGLSRPFSIFQKLG